MMNAFAPVMLSLAIFMSTTIILLTIWMTVVFEATYTREATPTNGNGRNDSIKTGVDGWPLKMSLRFSDFICSVPSPNLALTDDQLTTAWQLPRQTRLSPIMRDIARCKLAADWSRTEKGMVLDDRRCYCVNVWWAVVIFLIALAAFGFYSGYFFCSSPPSDDDGTNPVKLRAGRCSSAFWAVVWYFASCVYAVRNADAGMSHTPYGDMYPRAYYQKEPINWFVVFLFCLANCMLEGVKFLLYSTPSAKSGRNSVSAAQSSSIAKIRRRRLTRP